MDRKKTIEKKLSVLNPHILRIIDNSALHAHHSGNPNNEGNSHFAIEIAAKELDRLGKVKQHQVINNLLKEEFANGLHALSIKVITEL